jgi:hypothetical protein
VLTGGTENVPPGRGLRIVAVPSASRAFPWGIVAKRAALGVSGGAIVVGMLTQMPGSMWRAPPVTESLIFWR